MPIIKTKLVKPKRKLYLSYGYNMNVRAMKQRCPGASVVLNQHKKPVVKMLRNARLVFRGCADLDLEVGAKAPAGLWWITDEDERALDRFEGYPHMYEKFSIWLDPSKKTRSALIYLMIDRDGIYPPSAQYVAAIRTGYRNFNIDDRHLNEAIVHAYTDKNPSEQTRARRARQRKNSQHFQLVPIPESVQIARMEAERKRREAEQMSWDSVDEIDDTADDVDNKVDEVEQTKELEL